MPFFSDKQQRVVAASLTLLAVTSMSAVVLALCWAVACLVRGFSDVILPLAAAGVTALVLKPAYRWLQARLRLAPILAVLLLYLVILVPALCCLVFLGSVAVDRVMELCQSLPNWLAHGAERLGERFPDALAYWREHDMEARVRTFAESRWDVMLKTVQNVGLSVFLAGASAFQAVAALVSWAVFPVYLAFFLMARDAQAGMLEENLAFLKPQTRAHAAFLVREFVTILAAFFRGQLLIALVQAVLFAVGFQLIGLKYGWLLGLIMGSLNLIPYLGSMLGLVMTLPTALLQDGGGGWLLVLTLVVIVIVQAIEGNLLTPRIMGKQTGLHPVAVIFSILFWGSAFGGILGMILGIPLTAFLVVAWRLAKRHYLTPVI